MSRGIIDNESTLGPSLFKISQLALADLLTIVASASIYDSYARETDLSSMFSSVWFMMLVRLDMVVMALGNREYLSIFDLVNGRTDGSSHKHQGQDNMECEHSAAHGVLRMILKLNGEILRAGTVYSSVRASELIAYIASACWPVPLWN
jgi:hypothetical protein